MHSVFTGLCSPQATPWIGPETLSFQYSPALQLLLKAAEVYRSLRDSSPSNTVPLIKATFQWHTGIKISGLLLSFPRSQYKECVWSQRSIFLSLPFPKSNGPVVWTMRAEGDPASQLPSEPPFPHSPKNPLGRRAGCQNLPSWRFRQKMETLSRMCRQQPVRCQAPPWVLIWISPFFQLIYGLITKVCRDCWGCTSRSDAFPLFFVTYACLSHLCLHFSHHCFLASRPEQQQQDTLWSGLN